MSVYKRGEPKPLETFQYEHITFFGASQLCTYKIIVDEREMYFETPMVRESSPLNFFCSIIVYFTLWGYYKAIIYIFYHHFHSWFIILLSYILSSFNMSLFSKQILFEVFKPFSCRFSLEGH